MCILMLNVYDVQSYAGVKEIGPFHKCFSSVVGCVVPSRALAYINLDLPV